MDIKSITEGRKHWRADDKPKIHKPNGGPSTPHPGQRRGMVGEDNSATVRYTENPEPMGRDFFVVTHSDHPDWSVGDTFSDDDISMAQAGGRVRFLDDSESDVNEQGESDSGPKKFKPGYEPFGDRDGKLLKKYREKGVSMGRALDRVDKFRDRNPRKTQEGAKNFDEPHRWRVTLNNGKTKTVRSQSSGRAREMVLNNPDLTIIGVRSVKDLGPVSVAEGKGENPEASRRQVNDTLRGRRGGAHRTKKDQIPRKAKHRGQDITEAPMSMDLRDMGKVLHSLVDDFINKQPAEQDLQQLVKALGRDARIQDGRLVLGGRAQYQVDDSPGRGPGHHMVAPRAHSDDNLRRADSILRSRGNNWTLESSQGPLSESRLAEAINLDDLQQQVDTAIQRHDAALAARLKNEIRERYRALQQHLTYGVGGEDAIPGALTKLKSLFQNLKRIK